MCNVQNDYAENSHVNEYINYRSSSDDCKDNVRAISILKKLSKYEEMEKVPFQDFSDDQMEVFYKEQIIRATPRQAAPRIKAIKEFLLWMKDNDLIDNKKYLLHPFFRVLDISPDKNVGGNTKDKTVQKAISNADYDIIRSTMIFSEQEFEDYCNTFFEASNFEMEKAIHCLVWSGVPIGALDDIKRNDVNVQSRKVSFVSISNKKEKETIYIKSDYCMNAIINAINTSGYSIIRSNNKSLNKIYRDDDDIYLIRRVIANKDSDDDSKRLRGILAHISDKVKKQQSLLPKSNVFKTKYVNLRNLYTSGLFYRCSLLEDNNEVFKILGSFRWHSYLAWKSAL